MSLAFITMVWRDYWLLEKWIAYNATHVPKSQLYVINHGGDPKIDDIAKGCNVIAIPRDGIPMNFDRIRWDLIGSFAAGLLGFYDRVICTDVDELLIYTGDGPLDAYLTGQSVTDNVSAIGAMGLNLLPVEGGDPTASALMAQYPKALVSGKYSKPCVVVRPSKFTNGAHGLLGSDYILDPALLLVHLHYVTPDYTARMQERKEMAQAATESFVQNPDPEMEIRSGYWRNWVKSDRIMEQQIASYAKARTVDVSHGFDAVHAYLKNHLRQEGRKRHVVQAEIKKSPIKITLPERFRNLF